MGEFGSREIYTREVELYQVKKWWWSIYNSTIVFMRIFLIDWNLTSVSCNKLTSRGWNGWAACWSYRLWERLLSRRPRYWQENENMLAKERICYRHRYKSICLVLQSLGYFLGLNRRLTQSFWHPFLPTTTCPRSSEVNHKSYQRGIKWFSWYSRHRGTSGR